MIRHRCGALAVAAALVLAACTGAGTSTGPDATDGPAVHPLLADVSTFAFGLGVDPARPNVQLRLGAHDLVAIDGDAATPAVVDALQADGSVVLAYLSVGTFEPARAWFDEASEQGLLLERWDDWDEWYAAVDEPAARELLGREARRLLRRGVDGLFLDNVDMVEGHPDQADGMAELVAELDRLVGDDRLLVSQNGDPIAQGIIDHLDGWNREDLTFTYDFDADGYVPVEGADRREAVERIGRVRAAGVLVTTADYLPVVEPELEAEAVQRSCDAGAIPFVSDIGLTRVPDEPLRCP